MSGSTPKAPASAICCGTATEIDDAAMAGVVGLFALKFRDPSIMLDKVKGEPVYLILAMTPDKTIRMKPQNLVTGLPIRHLEAVG